MGRNYSLQTAEHSSGKFPSAMRLVHLSSLHRSHFERRKYRVFITCDFNVPGVNWDTGIINACKSEVRKKAKVFPQLTNYLYPKTFLLNHKGNVLFFTKDMTNLYKLAPHLTPVPFQVDFNITKVQYIRVRLHFRVQREMTRGFMR